jgi:hypothetical protein
MSTKFVSDADASTYLILDPLKKSSEYIRAAAIIFGKRCVLGFEAAEHHTNTTTEGENDTEQWSIRLRPHWNLVGFFAVFFLRPRDFLA